MIMLEMRTEHGKPFLQQLLSSFLLSLGLSCVRAHEELGQPQPFIIQMLRE